MPPSSSPEAGRGGRSVFFCALRQSGALLVLALVAALLAAALRPARAVEESAPPEVTWAQVGRWTGRVLFVDARDEAAYRRRHIPGALSMDESHWETELPEFIQAWHPGARVVVYCDSEACDASDAVARRLRRELGIEEVYVLKGGWASWLAAQKP